jgi:nucleotide-binding universal stress UspA family protein
MFRRILVPIDGSRASNLGLAEAIKLAKDSDATLCLLHVVDELVVTQHLDGTTYVPASYVEGFMEALRQSGRKLLARAERQMERSGVKWQAVLVETLGHRVAELIIQQARKWKADLIVIGTHGRRGLSRLVMGSDAEAVVREAPVPVLLVRSRGEPRPRARKRS